MIISPAPLLIQIWRKPSAVESLSVPDIELLVRQANASQLLASLAMRLIDADCYATLPEKAKYHFESALLLANRHQELTGYELEKIAGALKDQEFPTILLKGAAYSACELPLARGRIFSDIDILVPREHLQVAESQLLLAGWLRSTMDDYDDEYYRHWMHEIPPLTHKKRGSVLDVHHNILPLTANRVPEAAKLRDNAIAVNQDSTLYVLAPIDMLLHSATHLFHEGEFDKGLRDLIDLDSMFRQFSATEADFWQQLLHRAGELGLGRPLHYAMRYCNQILACPIPAEISKQAQQFAPRPRLGAVMDFFFTHIFVPHHSSCDNGRHRISKEVLYWRGHLLRMPLRLLIPHLLRKSTMRIEKSLQKEPSG